MVIPCHGGAELTGACVDSLLAQRGAHRLEFLLVDNAGDDATAALARLAPAVQVLRQDRNLGFAGGCNVGLRRAQAPLALVINNDTQAAPHLLTRLDSALSRSDRIGFAAPISNRVKGPARVPCGESGRSADGRAEIERELCDPTLGVLQDVDTLSGLCVLGRTETWTRLGGFDERFVPGNFEDDDLCLRARLTGHRLVIARDAYLHHEAHQTFRALGLDMVQEIERQHAVFRDKWRSDPAGRTVLAALANDPRLAAEHARAALRQHPDWPDADWYLGRQLDDDGHHESAIPHLQAFLRRCPNHPDAVVRLGSCWLAIGQVARAQQLWRWALSHCWFSADQGAGLLRRLGDRAHRSGDLPRAVADLTAALELRPDDGALLNQLGAALVELRRFDDAIPLLERAAATGLALAHTNLGICHFQRGSAELALQHFAEAQRRLPDDPTVQANYARARAASAPPG